MFILIDPPIELLLNPTIKNVTAWINKLKALPKSDEVAAELREMEALLKDLKDN